MAIKSLATLIKLQKTYVDEQRQQKAPDRLKEGALTRILSNVNRRAKNKKGYLL